MSVFVYVSFFVLQNMFVLIYSVCMCVFPVLSGGHSYTISLCVVLRATIDSKVSFVLWWLLYKSKCTQSVFECSSLFIVSYERRSCSVAELFITLTSSSAAFLKTFLKNAITSSAAVPFGKAWVCVGDTSERKRGREKKKSRFEINK